ncbi:MAG: hypothetical protein LBR00_03590 [Clostridiales Family XIII bacterium]|jgi:hypothetical protein|nr:hypothetical protein [Clostridiales Family XIII bacterium]
MKTHIAGLGLPENSGNAVYVVLTRSTTALSRLVSFWTGAEYTHAAISLDRGLSYMFSFGRRYANNPFLGCFHREDLSEGVYAKADHVPGIVIALPVSDWQYENICGTIREFLLNSHRYDFNYAGLATQAVGRSHFSERRFYCSEFVYHVLSEAGVLDLSIPRGRVRPQDFLWLGGEIYKGDLRRFREAGGAGGAGGASNAGSAACASNILPFATQTPPRRGAG